MNAALQRRRRIVRLRDCEHRRVQADFARAQSDLARLTQLSERLDALRANLNDSSFNASGHDLRMVSGMADRLDLARHAMVAPIQSATNMRDGLTRECGRAEARKDAAIEILVRDEQAAIALADMRRDACAPNRRNGLRLRMVDGGSA